MRLIEQTSWDGIAVVGGGVTGLLTAQQIASRGIPSLVIESRHLGGGQTSHAHGWLHRGHVFADVERAEVEQLRAGVAWWQNALTAAGTPRISEQGTIATSDRAAADGLAAKWHRMGLEFEPSTSVSDQLPYAYRTNEWSVNPVQALQSVVANGHEVFYAQAKVIGLRADGATGEANLVLDRAGRQVLLRARAVVIAAGVGIPSLIQKTTLAPSVGLRRSHMVVVRTSVGLPPAIAMPEQRTKGLFGVQRVSTTGRHWLFSNFLSYGGERDSPTARSAWRRSLIQTVRAYLPALAEDNGALWGSYPAVKCELQRAVPLGVPGQGLVATSASNAIGVVPGKFTSAPVIAQAAAETALARMSGPPVGVAVHLDDPPRWAAEDWEMVPLTSLQSFERPVP